MAHSDSVRLGGVANSVDVLQSTATLGHFGVAQGCAFGPMLEPAQVSACPAAVLTDPPSKRAPARSIVSFKGGEMRVGKAGRLFEAGFRETRNQRADTRNLIGVLEVFGE